RNDTLTSLQAAFLVGGPIALVLMSIGAYLLAGAALRPIESMRRRAAEISATSLDERLPVPPADDEVSRLGRTLNEMLARLEDGQAPGNLVDNACEHGLGSITITAGRHNSSVELHVLDEGPGLPPEFRDHAFKAFTRATPSGNGSGLGLAIVETSARAHEG